MRCHFTLRDTLYKAFFFLTPEHWVKNPEFLMQLLRRGCTAENIAAMDFLLVQKQRDSKSPILASFRWLPAGFNTAGPLKTFYIPIDIRLCTEIMLAFRIVCISLIF